MMFNVSYDSCCCCYITVRMLIVQKRQQMHQKYFIWCFLFYRTLQYCNISWIVMYNLIPACFHFCRSVSWRAQRQWLPLASFLPSMDNYYCPQSGRGTLCHWAQNRDPSALWRWATSALMLDALQCFDNMFLYVAKPIKSVLKDRRNSGPYPKHVF